jgi:hypothetical protein
MGTWVGGDAMMSHIAVARGARSVHSGANASDPAYLRRFFFGGTAAARGAAGAAASSWALAIVMI